MHKLTCLEDLPRPNARYVAAHNHRLVGGRVLIINDRGRWAWLAPEDYRDYLRGLKPGHRAWRGLQEDGFLKQGYDHDTAAVEKRSVNLLSWHGPARHILVLDQGGRMGPQTAVEALDFIFTVPGNPLRIELAVLKPRTCRSVIRLIVEYARRRGEWRSRAVELSLRAPQGPWDPVELEFLRAHQVSLIAEASIAGKPGRAFLSRFPASRIEALIDDPRADAESWTKAWAASGALSVKLRPGKSLWTAKGLSGFLGFYGRVLDILLDQGPGGILEENAAAFLSRRRWELGLDVLSELGYGPDGGVYTSGRALISLADPGLFRIADAAEARYSDLPKHPAVRACLAAAEGDNQPLCFQCVYKPFCALPPSENHRLQGTLWGQTPSSLLCSLHMGMLDEIFMRLQDPRKAESLTRWVGGE